MSYQERRAIATGISTFVFGVVYFFYVYQKYPVGNPYSTEVFHFWGSTIFILTPISIVINIVIQIQFNIIITMATREKERSISDERDNLIGLKGTRNAFYVFILGFVLSMGALAIDMQPSAMFIILIFSGIVASLVGNMTQVYFYRRGF